MMEGVVTEGNCDGRELRRNGIVMKKGFDDPNSLEISMVTGLEDFRYFVASVILRETTNLF